MATALASSRLLSFILALLARFPAFWASFPASERSNLADDPPPPPPPSEADAAAALDASLPKLAARLRDAASATSVLPDAVPRWLGGLVSMDHRACCRGSAATENPGWG